MNGSTTRAASPTRKATRVPAAIGARVSGVIVRQEWFGEIPKRVFRPGSQSRNLVRHTDQTKIQFAVSDRRLAGITFRQELQNDAISKVVRQRQVSLQRNALLRASRKQVAKPGDGRVAAVGRDQHSRLESLLAAVIVQFSSVRVRRG